MEKTISENADKLKTLSLRRSSIKGQITKFKNYLEDLINKKSDLNHLELAELTLKLGRFEILSSKFEEVQSELEILNAESMAVELDAREIIERDIIRLIAMAKDFMDQNSSNLESSRAESGHYNLERREIGVKLPQIEIAKFNGSFFHWMEFRDTFTSLVHKNERLSSIQKFHYLMSYLVGDASRVIANLEVSADNYEVAWSLLLERYNNKRLLVNLHLKSLFNIKPITRESEKSLRFLVDSVTKDLRALSSLGQPTTHWDVLIIYMLSSKLDSRTLEKWEEARNGFSDIPTLSDFNKFLTDRADVIEALNRTRPQDNNNTTGSSQNRDNKNTSDRESSSKSQKGYQTKSFASVAPPAVFLCVVCNANHRIYDCPTFKAKNIKERLADVSKYKLCENCLRQGHPASECRMGACRVAGCKGHHNSLLHPPGETQASVNFSKENHTIDCQVILSTALIEVQNPVTNQCEEVRALLDCGSQLTFISKSLQKRLGLKTNPFNNIKVIGIGNTCHNNVTESCVAQLNSLTTQYRVSHSCFVLDELTGELPKSPIDIKNLKIPQTVRLADPVFDRPGPIDILIGADLFWDVLGSEQRSLGPNYPKLKSSKFGWLLAGPMYTKDSKPRKNIHCNHAVVQNDANIDEMLTKFWSLEELPSKFFLSAEDTQCEDLFKASTTRLDSGRFGVELPLKDSPDCLGDSYYLAKKRFLFLEKRFRKNSELKSKYVDFIREYAALGHLSESPIANPELSYFLCHHAVIKECSESTKLRVVFNGSEPTSSGFSVNDILLKGPHVQDSLFSILVRARQYQYVVTGDIDKFYRQVCITKNQDRNLQLILWREEESLPLKTLQLGTITYGTASASYLSTRCLWQVGEECDDPVIKNIIQKDFYVDDLYTGCDDEQQLQLIVNSVISKLKSACFTLRKFKSNVPHLLDKSTDNESLYFSESTSTLGLGWNPASDSLHFPFDMPPTGKAITKRTIMSNSFKIFDPLGLISPCIILPKIMLQKLWQQKMDWDEPVSQSIQESWVEFVDNLPCLSTLQIPRKVICNSPKIIEMHVFSDASQCAYGACVYMRTINANDEVSVNLLCSKSKVSPLKPTTIPRLELAAALLAARLSKSVVDSIRNKPSRIVHWCDSSVVLAWLASDTSKLKTFVSNRVGEIIEISELSSWRYVPTNVNPADMISRGVNASRLRDMELWWSGPDYLNYDECMWPTLSSPIPEDVPERKSCSLSVSIIESSLVDFKRFSKLNKLQRSFAFVKRFVHNCRNPKSKLSGHLSVKELNDSFSLLCSFAQRESFSDEHKLLANGSSLNSKSKLLSLSPFLDGNLIRVGGRIESSNYSFETKHPIVLDSSHHLTKLLFDQEHLNQLHAGPQLLLASVRQSVWPINGRRLARQVVRRCVRCRRVQGKVLQPKMGNLPSSRLNLDHPFASVGTDFAGHFNILNRKGRGARLQKAYMCLFVCLRFKCVHLEAVSDLSKDAFMMALRRFVARRGKPIEIFSDNGGNFTASAKELSSFLTQNSESLSDLASQEGINFIFSPSYAPHFGGIWEAGVKSAKYHIRRIMGNSNLTFEELGTLFTQVEAILNSRPLCPLSSSPNDFLFLSPGHFLIGRQLTAMPYESLLDAKESQLQRYNRVEKLRQHFWQKWQKEYISELQVRKKWKTSKGYLKVGDLVLLHEDHVPPLNWRLGRVSKLFTGPDGINRVADVDTIRGCVRRALVRLCPLMDEEEVEKQAFQRGEDVAASSANELQGDSAPNANDLTSLSQQQRLEKSKMVE